MHLALDTPVHQLDDEVDAPEAPADPVQVDPLVRARIEELLAGNELRIVFQPLVDLATGRTIGHEALARFPDKGATSPTQWFVDATAAGLRTELEAAAITLAVASAVNLPSDTFLALNASPSTAIAVDLRSVLEPIGLARVILEITELAAVVEFPKIERAIEDLRRDGLRIALDDTGAGYVSLRHVIGVRPDLIKIDMNITRSVDSDVTNQAVASALCSFADRMGALVVAEGIETEAEREMLLSLGVVAGQGYLFGHPAPAGQLAEDT